ncbi:MAG: BlaI/MecI/CopY family transcriptional regulator [Oscillospiraceae bacterium]|nr:BlaI/MecI/CopY family transcriptional regulator [Oscillospiraceae bacterium]
MMDTRLGLIESRFADIVWANAPLSTRQLVSICNDELDWARTTTYTVLKKLCERGIFEMTNKTVTVLVPKEEFRAIRSQQFVNDNFQGSLPAFIAAFASRQNLSREELCELKKLINSMEA